MLPDETLAMSVAASYAQHPLFQPNAGSLQLDTAELVKFNDLYMLLTGHGSEVDSNRHAALVSDCLVALDSIFDGLDRQSSDPHLRLFLTALRTQCRRITSVGIDFARQRARAQFSSTRPDTARYLRQLEIDRCFLGQLSATCADEIRTLSEPGVARFRERAAAGRLTREDLSDNRGQTIKSLTRCLNTAFRDMGILDAVSLYSGRPMAVSGLALELSVPQSNWWRNAFPGLARPPHTLYAHLDESVDHPKAIVYVTTVAPNNGPTGYYPHVFDALRLNPLQDLVGRVVGIVGNESDSPLHDYYAKPYHQSMCSATFRDHYMALPESIRFNSHFGWDLLPDSAAERQLLAREERMTGPAGTFIVFDGARLLHRGGLIENGERVALQVIFSDARWSQRVANRIKRTA